jgi:hypothetical protein
MPETDVSADAGATARKAPSPVAARASKKRPADAEVPAEPPGAKAPRKESIPDTFAFAALEEDMCETSAKAFADAAALLRCIAATLGKTPETLRIWDPYYCAGAVVRHLGELGFPQVHNRNEDFYAVIASGQLPPHDVFLTNPAYSGDHIERLLRFCNSGTAKPFLLLMPNYVYMKPYYSTLLGGKKVWALCPPRGIRYEYESPKGVEKAAGGSKRNAKTRRTAPFASFWYVHLPPDMEKDVLRAWKKQDTDLTFVPMSKLPDHLRTDSDPNRHYRSKWEMERDRKKVASDGTPLCRTCGQKHGFCKHTRK